MSNKAKRTSKHYMKARYVGTLNCSWKQKPKQAKLGLTLLGQVQVLSKSCF